MSTKRRIISIKARIEGGVDLTTKEFEGLSQDDIATLKAGDRECRERLATPLLTNVSVAPAPAPSARSEWLFVSAEEARSDSPENLDKSDYPDALKCTAGPGLEFIPDTADFGITQNTGNDGCPDAPGTAYRELIEKSAHHIVLRVSTRKPRRCHATIAAKIGECV